MKGLPKTKRCNSAAVKVSVRFRFGFGVYVKQPLRPFHIYTEPKPNQKKIKRLKPYERFHICAETETEPKPNAEPKACTILILFFSVSVAKFQQTRQVILIKSAHTQPHALYKLSNHEANAGLSSETIVQFFTSTILLTTDFCGTIPRATIKTTNLMQ